MNRILLLIFVLILLNDNCSAQDTIVKMNGRKTICKVLEVTSVKVIYSDSGRTDQRTMDQIGISHIKYQDGTIELIQSTTLEKANQLEAKHSEEKKSMSKIDVFKSGISLSFQPGYSNLSKYNATFNTPDRLTRNLAGLAVKLENRWLYGKNLKFRNGFQLSWFEIEGYFDNKNFAMIFGLLKPGYCGVYRLTEKSGIEYSINAGLGILVNEKAYTGINLTPKLEYAKNNKSFGISYSTYLAGSQFVILGAIIYRYAIFHNFNLSYRIKF